jgi:ubiquinone/menaquinone biosynthesis C-methylase UbiE
MLDVARRKLASCPGQWTLSTADARLLPIDDNWADAAIAGWVFGHFTEWHSESWKTELGRAIAEMDRVVRPGGIEVVVDTLGTAVDEPAPPPR